MADFELDEREKAQIRYSLNTGDENKLFGVIINLIKKRVEFIAPIWKIYQREITGGAERDFYKPEQRKLYQLFLGLDEEYKNGRKTKYFVEACNGKTDLSNKTLENYYPMFVKKYKEEKEYNASELKDIDDKFIEYVKENFNSV